MLATQEKPEKSTWPITSSKQFTFSVRLSELQPDSHCILATFYFTSPPPFLPSLCALPPQPFSLLFRCSCPLPSSIADFPALLFVWWEGAYSSLQQTAMTSCCCCNLKDNSRRKQQRERWRQASSWSWLLSCLRLLMEDQLDITALPHSWKQIPFQVEKSMSRASPLIIHSSHYSNAEKRA